MANTFLAGNLTANPEHRSSEGAKPSVAFTVAVNRRRQINGKWEDASASFHRCVVWAEQAQRVLADLHKGDRVIVIGELRTHTYKDTEGKPHTSTVVSVEEVGPSLRFADAAVGNGGTHASNEEEWDDLA